MSPSSVLSCTEELYTRLVEIISPGSTSPPVVQEIAILPSSSHPTIQYDPTSDPPAIGIPKALLLSCFLRARSIFFSRLEACRSTSSAKWDPDVPIDKEWLEVCEATAVILLWEPNHLTAINWRKRAFMEKRARRAELSFLNSLQTSPMPQHAKSSTLWAYRLQILREEHKMGIAWREELNIVMVAGERHAKNYHAWEHARQVWRLLLSDDSIQNGSERENKKTDEITGMFQETVVDVHKWCLMHPRDISGWAFLAFLLRSAVNEATRLEEATKIIRETRVFVDKLGWKGESVKCFLNMAEQAKTVDETR